MRKEPNKNKTGGCKLAFRQCFGVLKIQEDAVPENTKKATKFGMKVFRGKSRLKICKSVFYFCK